MALRSTPLFALALVSLLSACGGGGGGSTGGGTGTENPPLHGTDLDTIEGNLGIAKNGDKSAMRAASTEDGSVSATIQFNSETEKLVMVGGGVQTGAFEGTSQSVMNGAVVRNTNGDGTVFYMPSIGSDMNVGMVSIDNGQRVVTGIVGRETNAAGMTTRTGPGGTANYAGVATYAREVGPQVVTYEGSISANVDFDTASLNYGTNSMNKTSDTGGATTMALNGSGTFNPNGTITGNFTTTTLDGAQNGSTEGAFYGADAGSMGLIFIAPGAAGGAILNEN
jgi:hypothetical protein